MQQNAQENTSQGRSQEFIKGDKPGDLGNGSPQRGPEAEFVGIWKPQKTPTGHGAVTKIDLR